MQTERRRELIRRMRSATEEGRQGRPAYEMAQEVKAELQILYSEGGLRVFLEGFPLAEEFCKFTTSQSTRHKTLLEATQESLKALGELPTENAWKVASLEDLHKHLQEHRHEKGMALVAKARVQAHREFSPGSHTYEHRIPPELWHSITDVDSIGGLFRCALGLQDFRTAFEDTFRQESLCALFPSIRVYSDGRSQAISLSQTFAQAYTNPALRKMFENFYAHVNQPVETLVGELSQDSIFARDTPVIRRAIWAHHEEDWITAICILAPLAERGTRYILEHLGGAIEKPTPTGDGGIGFRMLGSLLDDPLLKENLSPEVQAHIREIWIPLRNAVCHGFWGPDEYTPAVADQLLCGLLLMGNLSIVGVASQEPPQ